eukprot:m.196162 g.196162  ORF g.196162 m.196162 type:complete len:484 (+) comp18320_c0_seq4:882-2333(+)
MAGLVGVADGGGVDADVLADGSTPVLWAGEGKARTKENKPTWGGVRWRAHPLPLCASPCHFLSLASSHRGELGAENPTGDCAKPVKPALLPPRFNPPPHPRGPFGKWTEQDLKLDEPATDGTTASATSDGGVHYEELRPTLTHEALVWLNEQGMLKHVLSQNGDGLHVLSGLRRGNSLSELHGNVFVEWCPACGTEYERPFYTCDDESEAYYEELSENGSTKLKKPRGTVQCVTCGLNHRTGRKCSKCKKPLIDTIINFGDNLTLGILERAKQEAAQADVMLALGSTVSVTPASGLYTAGGKNCIRVLVNRQRTGKDRRTKVRVFGDCDAVMELVLRDLMGSDEAFATWAKARTARMAVYDARRQPDAVLGTTHTDPDPEPEAAPPTRAKKRSSRSKPKAPTGTDEEVTEVDEDATAAKGAEGAQGARSSKNARGRKRARTTGTEASAAVAIKDKADSSDTAPGLGLGLRARLAKTTDLPKGL